MPTWLFTAIWIVMIIWSCLEIYSLVRTASENGLREQFGMPKMEYTTTGAIVTVVWFIFLILLICYSAFG